MRQELDWPRRIQEQENFKASARIVICCHDFLLVWNHTLIFRVFGIPEILTFLYSRKL